MANILNVWSKKRYTQVNDNYGEQTLGEQIDGQNWCIRHGNMGQTIPYCCKKKSDKYHHVCCVKSSTSTSSINL